MEGARQIGDRTITFSFSFSPRSFSCISIGMYTLSVTLYNPAMYHNTCSKIDNRVFCPRFTLGGCAGSLHQSERSIFALPMSSADSGRGNRRRRHASLYGIPSCCNTVFFTEGFPNLRIRRLVWHQGDAEIRVSDPIIWTTSRPTYRSAIRGSSPVFRSSHVLPNHYSSAHADVVTSHQVWHMMMKALLSE